MHSLSVKRMIYHKKQGDGPMRSHIDERLAADQGPRHRLKSPGDLSNAGLLTPEIAHDFE